MKTEIKIILEDNGEINVIAPLAEKILCYGLLEIAKDLVRNYEEESKIVKPIIKMVHGGNHSRVDRMI